MNEHNAAFGILRSQIAAAVEQWWDREDEVDRPEDAVMAVVKPFVLQVIVSAERVAAAKALLSLAAEFEAEAEDLLAGRNTGLMDRLTAPSAAVCFRAAARMARNRAGAAPDAAEHAPAGHAKASHAQDATEALSAARKESE